MHSINTILIKKSELRDFQISKLLENKDSKKLLCLELPQNVLAFPELSADEVYKNFGLVVFADIYTDYYGGYGSQKAYLYQCNTNDSITILDEGNINRILNKYGISKEGVKDEFDSINLGNYRTNESLIYNSTYY